MRAERAELCRTDRVLGNPLAVELIDEIVAELESDVIARDANEPLNVDSVNALLAQARNHLEVVAVPLRWAHED